MQKTHHDTGGTNLLTEHHIFLHRFDFQFVVAEVATTGTDEYEDLQSEFLHGITDSGGRWRCTAFYKPLAQLNAHGAAGFRIRGGLDGAATDFDFH
jgi:hypothetical protein